MFNMYNKHQTHLVDERYELVSLIFRLAGNKMFREEKTHYQRKLDAEFGKFKEHPAVKYAAEHLQDMFGDIIFLYVIHISRENGKFVFKDVDAFTNGIVNLLAPIGRHQLEKLKVIYWTNELATGFLALINDFYIDSNFSEFFAGNSRFYIKHSRRYIKNVLNRISLDWFSQYGIKSDKMRVILSPTIFGVGCFGGWDLTAEPGEQTVYALLPLQIPVSQYRMHEYIIIHEFAHSIANPLAAVWYQENETFRSWCDDSVDEKLLPHYLTGYGMACEYLTRAYTIQYLVESANNDEEYLRRLFQYESKLGFRFIEQVYALTTANRDAAAGATTFLTGSRYGFRYLMLLLAEKIWHRYSFTSS